MRCADSRKLPGAVRRHYRLQCAHARIIVELDLSSAEAADNAPTMTSRKFTDFVFRHVPENPQLRRLSDDILGAY